MQSYTEKLGVVYVSRRKASSKWWVVVVEDMGSCEVQPVERVTQHSGSMNIDASLMLFCCSYFVTIRGGISPLYLVYPGSLEVILKEIILSISKFNSRFLSQHKSFSLK